MDFQDPLIKHKLSREAASSLQRTVSIITSMEIASCSVQANAHKQCIETTIIDTKSDTKEDKFV